MQHENKRRLFLKNPRLLVIVLALVALFTAAAGTMAWFYYVRSQQTVTLVHVSDLHLLGSDGGSTTALNLGSIDVSTPGSHLYAFGVKTTKSSYRIQLGYTTNVPFSYSIHPASNVKTGKRTTLHTEAGTLFYYDPDEYIEPDALFNGVKNHDFSYKKGDAYNIYTGSYKQVQECAEPQYWQSVDIERVNDIDFFILKITWPSGLANNKETDMIYLTAGAPKGG